MKKTFFALLILTANFIAFSSGNSESLAKTPMIYQESEDYTNFNNPISFTVFLGSDKYIGFGLTDFKPALYGNQSFEGLIKISISKINSTTQYVFYWNLELNYSGVSFTGTENLYSGREIGFKLNEYLINSDVIITITPLTELNFKSNSVKFYVNSIGAPYTDFNYLNTEAKNK